jgi:hypothetical protein
MDKELSGPSAVLRIPKADKDLFAFGMAVHDGFLGNPDLPNPSPVMAVFKADLVAFQDAATKAQLKTKGAVTQRKAKRRKVVSDLKHLKDYVQSVAEMQTDSATAAAIIEAVLMSVRKTGKHAQPELQARNTGVSGEVALAAASVARDAVYYWEFSLNQTNWSSVPETLRASTVITGLTPGQTYYFRFRALTRKERKDYSQVVRLMVT